MPVYIHLHLNKGEKIRWEGRRIFWSLWPVVLIALLTLWIYGLGLLFLIYAIVKWSRIKYLITNLRAIKVTEHYAFLLRTEIKEILLEELTSISATQSIGGKFFKYWNVILEGQQKMVWEGIKHPREVMKLLPGREVK